MVVCATSAGTLLSAVLESIATVGNLMSDPNQARHHELPRPPSKTIQRPPNQCRIVVTVEVELSKELMESARLVHMYDATDIMRAATADFSQITGVAELLNEMRHEGDLLILSTKIEPNK